MADERYYTLAEGCPVANNQAAVLMRGQQGGGLGLLQDTQLIETLAHFSRERIPERVVHAKAVGSYGEFEATRDCSDFTSARFLSQAGKKTPVLQRVSTVGGESGSADTARDVHGWAMKLYTDEGNLDWVFNNTRFMDGNLIGSRMKKTGSDRGTPRSVRHMNAYSGHTYKFTKADGTFKYAKIHVKTRQGVQNLTSKEASKLAGENPDYMIQDMFEAIERGEYPIWDVFVQLMSPAEAEKYRWNIFDMTKVWSHRDFPLMQIGTLTMNRNPRNYFADIEQAAFSPSTMVPGFGPSADPVLQARLFAYPDAARYRLGVNYQQLPTNAAKVQVYCPFQRDGKMRFDDNYGGDPNYVGSSLKPTKFYQEIKRESVAALNLDVQHEKWAAEVAAYTSEITDEDFVQPAALWEVIGREEGHQEMLIDNLVTSVKSVKYPELRAKVYDLFSRVNSDLGAKLREKTEATIQWVRC
ncbi:catalase-like domain-containing protein [Aspergillus filifer]